MPSYKGKRGFKRDKEKALKSSRYGNDDLKQYGKGRHRMRERTALAHGDYDLLSDNSYEEADDIWNWD